MSDWNVERFERPLRKSREVYDGRTARKYGLSKRDIHKIEDRAFEMADNEISLDEAKKAVEGGDAPELAYDYGEHGCVICRMPDGDLTFFDALEDYGQGPVVQLDDAMQACRMANGKPMGFIHTHPLGSLCLSEPDVEYSRNVGVGVDCVAARIRHATKENRFENGFDRTERDKLGLQCFDADLVATHGRGLLGVILGDPFTRCLGPHTIGKIRMWMRYSPSQQELRELAEEQGVEFEEFMEGYEEPEGESVDIEAISPDKWRENIRCCDSVRGKAFLRTILDREKVTKSRQVG